MCTHFSEKKGLSLWNSENVGCHFNSQAAQCLIQSDTSHKGTWHWGPISVWHKLQDWLMNLYDWIALKSSDRCHSRNAANVATPDMPEWQLRILACLLLRYFSIGSILPNHSFCTQVQVRLCFGRVKFFMILLQLCVLLIRIFWEWVCKRVPWKV